MRLLTIALLLVGVARADEKEALLEGKLPEAAPETLLVKSNCQVCHTLEYLTQQRLTEPQWKKTVEKMVKFGSPLQPDDAAKVIAFLAARFTTELPEPHLKRVAMPAAALPAKKKGKK